MTLDPVQVAAATSNRRLFFKEVCDALGAAGGTSPAAWAQALRSLAAAAATEEADAQRRAAAADLLAAWIDARVTCEGVGAWETRALAAAASELVALDDPALAPACAALASERATADPAAVVDAVLLGNVVPHADDLTRDDVKTRLPAWIPPEDGEDTTGSHAPGSRRRSAGKTPKAAASPVKPPRPSIPLPDSCRDRVRGVSAQDEDRLRRWATTWMRDATRDAESLLANSAASRAVSGDLAPVASRDAYADEAEDEEDAAERAEAARSAEARARPVRGRRRPGRGRVHRPGPDAPLRVQLAVRAQDEGAVERGRDEAAPIQREGRARRRHPRREVETQSGDGRGEPADEPQGTQTRARA